jgi:hypothetical protein
LLPTAAPGRAGENGAYEKTFDEEIKRRLILGDLKEADVDFDQRFAGLRVMGNAPV